MSTQKIPAEYTKKRPAYFRAITNELQQVEEVFSSYLNSSVHTITTVSSYVLNAGGKRLRPSLVLLSALSCKRTYDQKKLIKIAASTEMIHMATLMHDDVIDGADSRRGRATVNSQWSNHVSVLTGDYVLAKAFWLLTHTENAETMNVLSDATVAMAEGEMRQIEASGDINMLIKYYFPIISEKTAAFMSACCRIGAIITNSDKSMEDALANYGYNLGLAFQITDDILDLAGDPKITGKPVGGDIREGKVTLPVILTLEKVDTSERWTIEQIIQSDKASSDEIDYIRNIAESTGAVDESREIAARYIKQAIDSLDVMPDTESKECLEELARHILLRNH